MTVLLRLIALIFFLVALLTGGCSLVFSALVISDPAGDGILPVVLVGFLVGGLSLWAGVALWRKTRKSRDPDDKPPTR